MDETEALSLENAHTKAKISNVLCRLSLDPDQPIAKFDAISCRRQVRAFWRLK